MTEIDCEMFDKTVNHYRSADLGPEVISRKWAYIERLFKSLLRETYKMFMLITYITCFAIYLATQQCINLYFRGNISPFMTENNSSRFFWTPGINNQGRRNVTKSEGPVKLQCCLEQDLSHRGGELGVLRVRKHPENTTAPSHRQRHPLEIIEKGHKTRFNTKIKQNNNHFYFEFG